MPTAGLSLSLHSDGSANLIDRELSKFLAHRGSFKVRTRWSTWKSRCGKLMGPLIFTCSGAHLLVGNWRCYRTAKRHQAPQVSKWCRSINVRDFVHPIRRPLHWAPMTVMTILLTDTRIHRNRIVCRVFTALYQQNLARTIFRLANLLRLIEMNHNNWITI